MKLLLALALLMPAGQTDAACWWEGTTLHATGLPAEWSLTFEVIPVGVAPRPSEYEQTFPEVRTAYFWTRKGSGAKDAPRPPAQYRDYKVVAWC